MLPLRIGLPEQFALVRSFLGESGYTEKAICSQLGLSALHEYAKSTERAAESLRENDRLNLLTRVFFCGEQVSGEQLRSVISEAVCEAFEGLGLLNEDQGGDRRINSPVALYPAHGLYFVSDRWTRADHTAVEPSDDIVFPAISQHTYQFLKTLPEDPCESFLDLCSGTAVAALVAASRYARHAWAVDITERATQCGEFNRMLNGIANVTVLKGNLYAPLEGMAFERIVAHPPYVPVMQPSKIFYDGGEDGERVTRGIIEGLPRHLKPNGRFYCLTMGVDREGEPFEERTRQWLGEGGAELDLLYVVRRIEDLTDFAYQATVTAHGGWEQVEQWKAHFQKLGVKELVHGLLVIEKKTDDRPAFTLRRKQGRRSGPSEPSGCSEIDWLFGWEAACAESGFLDTLLLSKPTACEGLELQVLHRHSAGELTPSEFTLETEYPFSMECKVQPWMAMLLAQCDGKTSAQEIFETCKRDRLIHPETPARQFAQVLRTLISGGFLQIDGFRLPATAASSVQLSAQASGHQ